MVTVSILKFEDASDSARDEPMRILKWNEMKWRSSLSKMMQLITSHTRTPTAHWNAIKTTTNTIHHHCYLIHSIYRSLPNDSSISHFALIFQPYFISFLPCFCNLFSCARLNRSSKFIRLCIHLYLMMLGCSGRFVPFHFKSCYLKLSSGDAVVLFVFVSEMWCIVNLRQLQIKLFYLVFFFHSSVLCLF